MVWPRSIGVLVLNDGRKARRYGDEGSSGLQKSETLAMWSMRRGDAYSAEPAP